METHILTLLVKQQTLLLVKPLIQLFMGGFSVITEPLKILPTDIALVIDAPWVSSGTMLEKIALDFSALMESRIFALKTSEMTLPPVLLNQFVASMPADKAVWVRSAPWTAKIMAAVFHALEPTALKTAKERIVVKVAKTVGVLKIALVKIAGYRVSAINALKIAQDHYVGRIALGITAP